MLVSVNVDVDKRVVASHGVAAKKDHVYCRHEVEDDEGYGDADGTCDGHGVGEEKGREGKRLGRKDPFLFFGF